jgi:hypothetical protein
MDQNSTTEDTYKTNNFSKANRNIYIIETNMLGYYNQ